MVYVMYVHCRRAHLLDSIAIFIYVAKWLSLWFLHDITYYDFCNATTGAYSLLQTLSFSRTLSFTLWITTTVAGKV